MLPYPRAEPFRGMKPAPGKDFFVKTISQEPTGKGGMPNDDTGSDRAADVCRRHDPSDHRRYVEGFAVHRQQTKQKRLITTAFQTRVINLFVD